MSEEPSNPDSVEVSRVAGGTDSAAVVEPELDIFGRAPKGRQDWSHRKGEPRLFALMWMIYLMIASLMMVSSIAAVQSISPGVVRPAARAMVLTSVIGLCLLWPMVRLSQKRPGKSTLGAVGADLVVLLPPTLALILPQTLTVLANWPVSVAMALLLGVWGWALLLGAILALALRTVGSGKGGAVEGWHRGLWTVVFLVLVLGPPAIHGFRGTPMPMETPAQPIPGPGAWLSPVSFVLDLMRDRPATGRSAVAGPLHWAIVLRVWAVGLMLWGAGFAAMLARPLRAA